MKEGEQEKLYNGEIGRAILETVLTACAGGILATFAFSRGVVEEIYNRARGRSEISGRVGRLEAAHIDHNRLSEKYDDPKNGRLVLIQEHLIDHIEREGRNGLTLRQNAWAIQAIWARMSWSEREEVKSLGYDLTKYEIYD